MGIMDNRISVIHKSHQSSTSETFRRFGYDPRLDRIKVKIQSEDEAEDSEISSVIVTQPAINDELSLQDGVLVITVDGQHRYEAIVELRNDS